MGQARPGVSTDTTALELDPVVSPSSLAIRHEPDDAEIASVSTETEDDPVNMAMRATLGGSNVDEEEHEQMEEDEEEVIVWGRG